MKLRTFILATVVGVFGTLGVSAHAAPLDSHTVISNILKNGETLQPGQAIRSGKNQYVAILQKDGNFCVYRLDAKDLNQGTFVKCTMTVGAKDKQAAKLVMQADGNLVLYNDGNQPLWATDTYRGGDDRLGKYLVMYDDGNLVLVSRTEKAIWNFSKGRLY